MSNPIMEGLFVVLLLFGLCHIAIADTMVNGVGKWSRWEKWGECSVTCGGGTKTRTRVCLNPTPQNGDVNCVGDPMRTRDCNPESCSVVNGIGERVWSRWEPWSECSVTCGGGTETRTRHCLNPTPQNGKVNCVGVSMRSRDCNTGSCPEPCSPPVDPSHGTFKLSRGNGFFQDSIITLECDEGYRVSSESSIAVCTEGQWTGSPTCEIDLPETGSSCEYPIQDCGLRIFMGGREIRFHEFRWIPHRSSIVLAYSQSHVSTSVCNDGNWAPAVETCRSTPGCPALTVPSNVTVNGRGTSYGSIRAFTCPEGYTTANGVSVVTSECGENGQWTNQPPICSVEKDAAVTTAPVVDPCDSSLCEDWQTCIPIGGVAMCFCKHPQDCPYVNDPHICGTDGKNYTSMCNLKTVACFFDRDVEKELETPCPPVVEGVFDYDYSLNSEQFQPTPTVDEGSEQTPSAVPAGCSVGCEMTSLAQACQNSTLAFVANMSNFFLVDRGVYSLEIGQTYWGNVTGNLVTIEVSNNNNCFCPHFDISDKDLIIISQSQIEEGGLKLHKTDYVALADGHIPLSEIYECAKHFESGTIGII